MTKSQIESWVRQSKAMVDACGQVEAQVDQLIAHKQLTDATGNHAQTQQIEETLANTAAGLDKMLTVLLERTNSRDFEQAKQLVLDVELRVQQADLKHQEWRAKLAQFDLAVTNGAFADTAETGVTRADAEAVVVKLHSRYDTAIQLASDAIPNVARLVRV